MAEQGFQDKTEQATPKRREEARKKGEVAKSRELASIAVLTAGVIYLFFAAKNMSFRMGGLIEDAFSRIPEFSGSDSHMMEFVIESVGRYLQLIVPIMLLVFIVAAFVSYAQTGIIWSVEPLAPKASKIDPIQGLARMVSLRSLLELCKSIAKIMIVGWAAYSTLKEEFSHLLPLIYQEGSEIMAFLALASWKIVIRCCWVIAILAVLDYIYQRWEFSRKLRMTKQEVRDEFKHTEGDPLVKSRIRSIQREMARRRMMEQVPKADVVITNPDHLAVALLYKPSGMTAPRVVAKGADLIAMKIKELAREHGVPIVENKALAQNLYKLDLDGEIPAHFYQAVAEILAYVYRLKRGQGRI